MWCIRVTFHSCLRGFLWQWCRSYSRPDIAVLQSMQRTGRRGRSRSNEVQATQRPLSTESGFVLPQPRHVLIGMYFMFQNGLPLPTSIHLRNADGIHTQEWSECICPDRDQQGPVSIGR